jgi:catechol 2,3-dioxygenase-like lactoylglutathione lyase family enzyme
MGLPGCRRVDHVALTVPDLDAAVRFYCEVFGAREVWCLGPLDSADLPRASDGRDWTDAYLNVAGARLRFAMLDLPPNFKLELFEYEQPRDARHQPPRNCDWGSHHIAFAVDDLDTAVEYLRAKGLKLMQGPIMAEYPPVGARVNYALDPWGNQLEIIQYTVGEHGVP